jgi:hypothetical protein
LPYDTTVCGSRVGVPPDEVQGRPPRFLDRRELDAYLGNDIRNAIGSYSTCRGLVADVLNESPSKETRVADEVVALAKDLAGGSWTDELSFGAAKVLAHR